jgi:nitrate reductase assembly molybdenum cofactor insertion protein NarJ
MKKADYVILAEMFRYPTDELKAYTGLLKDIVMEYDPALISRLNPFIEHIRGKKLSFQEEYYCSTFDVQALCCLDLGYVLLGDDHERGTFLAHMKEEQDKAGNPCGNDLADFLPNVLTLLSKIQDQSFAAELACMVLKPALRGMIAGFGPVDNIYKDMLDVLVSITEVDFTEYESERITVSDWRKSGFTRNINEKTETGKSDS